MVTRSLGHLVTWSLGHWVTLPLGHYFQQFHELANRQHYELQVCFADKYEDIWIVYMSPLTHISDIAERAQATATSWASAANTTATKQRRSASSGGKRSYFDPRPVFVIMA